MGPTPMSVLVNDGMMYPVVWKSAANCGIGRVHFSADVSTFPLAVPTLMLAALMSSSPCGEFGAMYRCVAPESKIPVCCCERIFSFSSYSVGIYVWLLLQLKLIFCCPPPLFIFLELYAFLFHELPFPVFSVRHLALIKLTSIFPMQCRAADRSTMCAYSIGTPWKCSPAGGGCSLPFLSIYLFRQTLGLLLLSGNNID